MKCEDVRESFSEYYDGERDDKVAAHLKDCAACASEYESFCNLIDEIRALPEPQLPSGFFDDLMYVVKKSQKKRGSFYAPYVLAAAASILLVMIWVGIPNFNYTDETGDANFIAFKEPDSMIRRFEVGIEDIAPFGIEPVGEMPQAVMSRDLLFNETESVSTEESNVSYRIILTIILTAVIAANIVILIKRKKKYAV
jgi:anti-sigma factor RsiW